MAERPQTDGGWTLAKTTEVGYETEAMSDLPKPSADPMDQRQPPVEWPRGLLIACACAGVATLLRVWPLGMLEIRAPWITYYPAVMVAALLGGLIGGLATTLLAVAIAASAFPILYGASVLQNAGDLLSAGIFALNATGMSVLAAMVRRRGARLASTNRQLIVARDAALESERAKSRFLAAMSHELRTPLNAILGFSDLLRSDAALPRRQMEMAASIHSSGQHLLTLINDILDLAKIEAGRQEILRQPFSLPGLVAEIELMMRPLAAAKSLALRVECATGLPVQVIGDQRHMRQVLLNLLGNAVNYTNAGSVDLWVDVGEQVDPGTTVIRFRIRDSGPGITVEDQAKLFRPFVQLQQDSTSHRGTGLGLAIAQQLAALMGGSLGLDSSLGRGSTFTFSVPLETHWGPPAHGPAPSGLRLYPVGDRRVCILYAEDHPANRLLMQSVLADLPIDLNLAEDGLRAVVAADQLHPDLIFMDMRLPGIDGMEAMRRIRLLPVLRPIPMIAVTASVFPDEVRRLLDAGAVEMIAKPYQAADIMACLLRHLPDHFRRQEGAPSADIDRPLEGLTRGALALLPETDQSDLKVAILKQDVAATTALGDRLGIPAVRRHAERLEFSLLLHALQPPPKEDQP